MSDKPWHSNGPPAVLAALGASACLFTILWLAPTQSAAHSAQQATTTPTATPTVVPPPTPGFIPQITVRFIDGTRTISWDSYPGADQYRLTGRLDAFRANASDPLCSSATVAGDQSIAIDETLAASVTEYAVPLPPLPPGDIWFVTELYALLEVSNSAGQLIANGNTGLIVETVCLRLLTPTATLAATTPKPQTTTSPQARPVALPSTGGGGSSGGAAFPVIATLAIVASVAATVSWRAFRPG